MKYLTSDLHLGHLNVISYCNRPYKDVAEMNDAIVQAINSRVQKNDELYILGDVSLNPKWMEFLMERIVCRNVHLIVGNHDSVFQNKLGAKPEKTAKFMERYFRAGFKSIQNTLWVTLSKKKPWWKFWGYNKEITVQLSHFPFVPEDIKAEDTRYLNHRPKDLGQILLAGHSHCVYLKRGRQIDVGFDGALKVWSEEEIIDLIEDPRDYIPSRVTEYYKANKEKTVLKNGDY